MDAHTTLAAFNMLNMDGDNEDQVSIANHEDLLMLQSILSCDSQDEDSSSSSVSFRSRKVSSITEYSSSLEDFSMDGEAQESSSAVDTASSVSYRSGIIAQYAESSSDSISIEPMIQRVKSFADFIFEESFGTFSSEVSNHFMDDVHRSCISIGDDDNGGDSPLSERNAYELRLSTTTTGTELYPTTSAGNDPELVSNFDSDMTERYADMDL